MQHPKNYSFPWEKSICGAYHMVTFADTTRLQKWEETRIVWLNWMKQLYCQLLLLVSNFPSWHEKVWIIKFLKLQILDVIKFWLHAVPCSSSTNIRTYTILKLSNIRNFHKFIWDKWSWEIHVLNYSLNIDDLIRRIHVAYTKYSLPSGFISQIKNSRTSQK